MRGVLGGLSHADPLIRLQAAKLLAVFPSDRATTSLRSALADPVCTVPWCAVTALARLGERDGLADVLDRCPPREPRQVFGGFPQWGEYDDARAALAGP